LRRLHGPIGLYIGSKTPAEIAISILVELTAVRNGVVLPAAMHIAAAKDALETPLWPLREQEKLPHQLN
jgi:xanthine dehydrogenase accessory factor